MNETLQSTRDSIGILYEDSNVLVINKPVGIAMHKINSDDPRITIHDVFIDSLADNDPIRGGIVHRLDKDTSGVVILAKNTSSLSLLQRQFADRTAQKSYLALLWGHLSHPKARIELPLSRSTKSPTAMRVDAGGKMSISEYRVLSEPGPYSYLEVSLHTGRTHQIRVQFAHIGHPVVGDKMYGHKPLPQGLSRQFLHAYKLSVMLPNSTKVTTFEAPLAPDLQKFLEQISG